MKCEICGTEFFEDWRKDIRSRRTPARFCSKKCAAVFGAKQSRRDYKQPLIPCKICGRVFATNVLSSHEATCDGSGRTYRERHPTTPLKGRTFEQIHGKEKAEDLKQRLSLQGKKNTKFKDPLFWTPERRLAQSNRKKDLYALFPEKHPNRRLANNRSKMSYPERLVFDALQAAKIPFEHNKQIGKRFVDFYIIEKNIVIEVDGERWHSDKEKEAIRDAEIGKDLSGVKILHLKAKKVLQELENKFIQPMQ